MRKYQQAALAIIATISVVALIFYRHEYNKLRFVLEAFNYFGHPSAKSSQIDCTDLSLIRDNVTSLKFANHHFGDPIPTWQRLNDEAYVYSAYTVNDRQILVLGFARVKALKLLTCRIFYENDDEPVNGIFTYKTVGQSSIIDQNSDVTKRGIYSAYHFICKTAKINEKRIVGVSFPEQTKFSDDAIVLSVKTMEKSANHSEDIALCVAPTQSPIISHSDMIDFISYHHSIGISHFVIYDFGIPRRLNDIIETISRKLNFSYTIVPWNFPFRGISKDVIERIIQTDCRYRTYENVEIVTTLTWNDFIIMKHHRTIEKLFRDIVEVGFIADRYEIMTSKICVQRDKTKSTNDDGTIVFGSEPYAGVRPIYFYRSKYDKTTIVNGDDGKIRETTFDVIYVNRYERHCNLSMSVIPPDDPYVGKFDKNIRNLPIWKLYKLYENLSVY